MSFCRQPDDGVSPNQVWVDVWRCVNFRLLSLSGRVRPELKLTLEWVVTVVQAQELVKVQKRSGEVLAILEDRLQPKAPAVYPEYPQFVQGTTVA